MERRCDDRDTDTVFDRLSADLCCGLVVLVNCNSRALPSWGARDAPALRALLQPGSANALRQSAGKRLGRGGLN
jgi:hypothetical protein